MKASDLFSTYTSNALLVLCSSVWYCALVIHKDSDLQLMLDCFSESAKLFGPTISPEKTEVLHQPAAPGGNNTASVITIDSTQSANGESFKYLGSIISQVGNLNRETDAQISKTS